MTDKTLTHPEKACANKIVSACMLIWKKDPALQSNCSGFVQRVALQLGINIEGTANTMCQKFASRSDSSWVAATSRIQAAELAKKGFLVIAAKPQLKGSGHVMIVLPDESHDGYPRVIGGGNSLGRSDGSKRTVRDC